MLPTTWCWGTRRPTTLILGHPSSKWWAPSYLCLRDPLVWVGTSSRAASGGYRSFLPLSCCGVQVSCLRWFVAHILDRLGWGGD